MKKAACICVINGDGNILAVSRKNDPDAFGLPGGGVEEGESFEEAAHREMKEETGLSVKNLKLIFSRICEGEEDHEVVTFSADLDLTKAREERDPEETGVVAWVTPETLLNGPFGAYNLHLFKALEIIKD